MTVHFVGGPFGGKSAIDPCPQCQVGQKTPFPLDGGDSAIYERTKPNTFRFVLRVTSWQLDQINAAHRDAVAKESK